jgi:membrane protein DedA with SNARE-associated domain
MLGRCNGGQAVRPRAGVNPHFIGKSDGPRMAPMAAGILSSLLTNFGYAAVFALVGAESLGIPVPGETMLITASVYAGVTHKLSIAGVIGAAIAGAIIGDNVGYTLGYRKGLPFLRRYGDRIHFGEDRLKLARYMFMKYGGKVVFFGRFVTVLRTYAAFLAGTSHMHWRRFFAFNAIGGITWAVAYGLAGYYGGYAFKSLSTPLDIAIGIVGAAGVVAIVVFLRRNAARLTKEAERALPDS